jgi:superfamily II DNA or RNA helicase
MACCNAPVEWVTRSPRETALVILTALYGSDAGARGDAAPRTFALAPFQEAAVARARTVLARWGGVLVADVVGLGKTYVALALIEEELRRGGRVLAVVPASLRSQWRGPLRRLDGRCGPERVRLVSHAQLSRGSFGGPTAGGLTLVVVDEAHRFRNPRTRRYAALAGLCSGARVLLVTATPINNGPGDLHSLLRLFAPDDAFLGLGVPSLQEVFAHVDPGTTPPGLQRVVREVVVRRTRAILTTVPYPAAGNGALSFPRRAPPRVVRFEDPRIPALVGDIDRLELAAYQHGYGDAGTGGGTAALVRLALLKRLESGAAALDGSLRRQLAFCRAFLDAAARGRLLRPGAPGTPSYAPDADPLQLVLFDLVAEPWPPDLDADRLRASVERDAARLGGMRRRLAGPDPKLAALRSLVTELDPDKVLVFTEFRDTAHAIWQALAPHVPLARIDGGGAWLGVQPSGRGAVIHRFAPRANGAPAPPARERPRVLVATDVVAEGMNLQDARHVVCYDLPWNPVRIMQRIGRVDRLGSPHDEVVPHLFLPAHGLEAILGLTRRLRAKLGTIATTMDDDDVEHLLARLARPGPLTTTSDVADPAGADADAADPLVRLDARQTDPLETLRARWIAINTPTALPPARAGTPRVVIGCLDVSPYDGPGCQGIVLTRFRGQPRLIEVGRDGHAREPGPAMARLIQSALDAPPGGPVGNEAGSPYKNRDAGPARDRTAHDTAAAALAYFHAMEAAARAPRHLRASDPAARVARRLRRALADDAAWIPPHLLDRADRTLQRLERPLTASQTQRLRDTLAEADDDGSPESLLDRIAAVLGNSAGPPDPEPPDPPVGDPTTVLAVLLEREAGGGPAG